MNRPAASAPDTLLLIDIQNDYFPGGAYEVPGSRAAADRATFLLDAFRTQRKQIMHVQHIATRPNATFFLPGTAGAELHASVRPNQGEAVVTKHFPNAFRETELLARLRETGAKHLLIAGMMTHMCIDATTRAAHDLGFTCTVASDACAAPAQSHGGVEVPAPQVHAAFLAALSGSYAEVIPAAQAV